MLPVASSLNFGIIHWGIASDWERVFVLQKSAVRILALSYLESCREAFKQLSVLTIPGLYINTAATFVCKHKDFF